MKNVFKKTCIQFARMLLLLIAVSIVCFALVQASPVDPLQANVGQIALASMSDEQIAKLESYWGVSTPAFEKYMSWASDVLHGDLGISLLYRRPVISVIGEKLSNSILVLTFAWIFSGLIGFILGIIAGAKEGTRLDKAVTSLSLLLASTPTFWLALVFLIIFSVQLQIFPIGLATPIGVDIANVTFWDKLYHALLPALTLSIIGISNILLHTREKMIDVMQSDYVLFARARGESELSIIKNHGFRNVILPAMTLQFASISEIIGGSVLVEQVFSFPGLGQAAVTAGLGSDVPLLLGITLITSAIVFAGNFLANLLYAIVDPRIRKGGVPL